MEKMSLKPFLSYYGSKWRAAPHYPDPVYPHIVEPFAGAAGYSLRFPHLAVTLIEKDPMVFGVWDCLLNVKPAEILALPNIGNDQTVNDFDLPQEARWLIGFWLNKGVASPCLRPSKWMRAGSHLNSFWGPAIRLRIASQLEFIQHWKIVHGSYEDAPDIEATWFIDPPYQIAGSHYRQSSKHIDYPALGKWCQSRKGHVVVCENEGATWLPFRSFMSIRASNKPDGAKWSEEVIWTRGDNLFDGLFT